MVEVFKTNVQQQDEAGVLLGLLTQRFPLSKINFDLEDCDKILRVEADTVAQDTIVALVRSHGYLCHVLE